MVILASEDIGNADPLALIFAVEGFKAVEIERATPLIRLYKGPKRISKIIRMQKSRKISNYTQRVIKEKSKYYEPSDVGYEKEIRERLKKLCKENSH